MPRMIPFQGVNGIIMCMGIDGGMPTDWIMMWNGACWRSRRFDEDEVMESAGGIERVTKTMGPVNITAKAL